MKKHHTRPGLPRVIQAEVSEKHFPLRVVLLAMSVALAICGIGYGLYHMLSSEPGWQMVEYGGSEMNVSEEFTLQYNFGASGLSATVEKKELTVLYAEIMEESYRVFSSPEPDEADHNLAYVNRHPNQELTVHPELYGALAKLQHYGSRYAYLGPCYVEYNRMFLAESPEEAALYNPFDNPEQAAYLAQIAGFANDPQHIEVELLGENRLILHVSDEYLAFAREYELAQLLDLGWTRNAFIVDWVARAMAEKNLTRGFVASFDGFTRNLDGSGEAFTQNVFDRLENEIFLPAKLQYQGPMTLVSLRNYAMDQLDRWHYYSFSDQIVSVYLDPADGLSRSSTDNLLSWSRELGCADVLLQTAPLFIADTLDEAMLQELADHGVYSIWAEGEELRYNAPDARLTLDTDKQDFYTLQLVTK